MEEPEIYEFVTGGGILRVTYEMSIGDLVIASVLALILLFLILRSVLSILWR